MATQRVRAGWLIVHGFVTGCAVSGATPGPVDGGFTLPAEITDASGDGATDPGGGNGDGDIAPRDGESSPIADGADDPRPSLDAGDEPSAHDAGTVADAGRPTPPPLPPSTCTGDAGVPSATDIGLFVRYKVGGDGPQDQEIKPHLTLENRGTETVSLSEVTITYWFTREGDARRVVFECDYAALGCSLLSATSGDACGPGVDTYLRIAFSGGQLAPGASTGEMQLRLHKDDYSAFDETNDYSYGADATAFTEVGRITLTRGEDLVWGELPY